LRHLLWQTAQPIRQFSSTSSCLAVDKSLLSKLRKQTGIPFINCKKALEKFDNDFDGAKKWLLEEAQKAGWARATKLQSRPMSQGLVALLGDPSQVTMIEVNCETDFVAKNEKFISLVEQLAQECTAHFEKQAEKTVFADKAALSEIKSSNNMSLGDMVALCVGNLGENMALRRAAFVRADPESKLSFYVHPSAPGKNIKKFQMGKYGSIVDMVQTDGADKPTTKLQDLGGQLCQHIVGMNPKTLGQASDDGDIKVDKVDAGLEAKEAVEEDVLLKQDFLLDSSMTVGQLLCLKGAKVNGFVRFACGEEVEGEKDV